MIREATPADEPALSALQRLLREYDPGLLPYAIRGPPVTLVANGSEGYLIAFLDRDADHGTAYLAELVVAPDRRREGVGSRLLDGLHERAVRDECTAVELVVHPENAAARSLYEANGYERVGTRADFYETADGIVMCRTLSELDRAARDG